MLAAYQLLLHVFEEKLGLIVPIDEQDDFSLSDYIVDSIAYIQFIVAIEEELGIVLPDDFIDIDILDSSKGFAEKLDCFLNSKSE